MYRQHEYTGQRTTTQPSLCSVLSKKLFFKSPKSQGEGKAGSSSASSTGKGREVHKEGNELKRVIGRLKRITPFLSEAYLSHYGSEKGKKGCESCSLNKETYKLSMHSVVKVIEVIVDGVISKEQKEMLDKEDEKQGTNKPREKDKTKDEKKLSIKFEVYCRKNIDHNLKCVLLQLQKIIGDTLLQVCYCKMKKDTGDNKCKQYNLSIIDLEQLKFEYSNLTNKIILLFKTPLSKQTDSPHKCIDCLKEEITDYINKLENMLKNGRNLKVTMRNENAVGKCCSRTTPHVHATVQGKPRVLKYELPFEVTKPSQKLDESLKRESPPFYDEWSNDESLTEEAPPYDEWPKYFSPEPVIEVDEGSQMKPLKERERPSSRKSSLLEKEASGKNPSTVSYKSVKSLKSDTSPIPDQSEKKSPSKIKPSVKSNDSTISTPPPSRTSRARSSLPSTHLTSLPLSKDKSSDSDLEKYCGCNFNLVYEKLNVEQNKTRDEDLKKTEPEKTPSSHSESDSFFSSDDSDSDSAARKGKKVSFIPQGKHRVLYVQDTPSGTVFKKEFENHDYSPKSSKTRSSKIENVRGQSLSYVNSVTSVKNNDPPLENSKTTKDRRQSNIVQMSFVGVPQYEIKQSLSTGPKITDQQIIPSSILNKQQVNEVMKDLGATKLLSVSLPAECCKNNKNLNDFKCTTDLPFSASLHSLPLDQDDLNHITRVVEKLISSEEIVLDPDFDKQWEIQYIEETDDVENEAELRKSIMARDNASNVCIEIQSEKTLPKKKPSKNFQKDVINLPTINEEKMSSNEKTIRQSLPEDKEVNKNDVNKNHSSSKFRTMELRYLTIEYPHTNKNKTSERAQSCRKVKSNACLCLHKYDKQLHKYLNNINYASRIGKGCMCYDYLNSRSRIIKTPSSKHLKKIDQVLGCTCNKNPSLSPVEELIMLDVIYLTSDINDNTFFTAVNPSNNILEFCDDNMKPPKSISSNDFFKENIVFETIEKITTTNISKIKIKKLEVKDLTSKIEQTFQELYNFHGNCEISESVSEMLNKKAYFKTGFCKEEDILNSRKQGETFLNSKCLKLKTNLPLINILPIVNKKEQIVLKSLNSDWSIIPVENKVNLHCHSLNHRNYFIYKKAKSKIIVRHLNPIKSNNYELKRRKPSMLNNTAVGFKLIKCKISTPVIKFSKISNISLHYEIPQLMISQKNQKLMNVEGNFGLVKNYTSVEDIHKIESVPNPRNVQDLLKCYILKEKIDNTLTHTNSMVFNKSFNLSSQMSNYSTDNKKDDNCSFDYLGSFFYLYDVNGQLMTETSGKPLHTIDNEMLMKLVDSAGENDINTLEPRISEILKVLTDSGGLMDLYEGQPLLRTSSTLVKDL